MEYDELNVGGRTIRVLRDVCAPTIHPVFGEKLDLLKGPLLAPSSPSLRNEGTGEEAITGEVVDDFIDQLLGKQIHGVRSD